MKFSLFNSESKLAFLRCEHRSPSGRQCSQSVCSTDPRFSGTHKPTPEQFTAAELAEAAGTLSSPTKSTASLRPSSSTASAGASLPRKPASTPNLCQNLPRSLREIDRFREAQSERKQRNRIPENFDWSLPRPDRSDPTPPVQTEFTNASVIATENVGAGLARPPLPAESASSTPSPTDSSACASSTSSTALKPPIFPAKPAI